jgi:hypothetical protein
MIAFAVWIILPHFLEGKVFFLAYICSLTVLDILILKGPTFVKIMKQKSYGGKYSRRIVLAGAIVTLVCAIIMLPIGQIFPIYFIYGIECVIFMPLVFGGTSYVLSQSYDVINFPKETKYVLALNTAIVFLFLLQIFERCSNGYQFSIRILLIPLGLATVLCAYFYRITEDKSSKFLMQAWRQAVLMAIVVTLVCNIQLDRCQPQIQQYKIFARNNFYDVRILDDGRWIAGIDTRVDDNGIGFVEKHDGWFQISYCKEK